MRLTLEQLKAMSDEQLRLHWSSGEFPFDHTGECNYCLIEHAMYDGCNPCKRHSGMTANVKAVRHWRKEAFPIGAELRPHLDELYALRIFYDSLYEYEDAPGSDGALAAEVVHAEVGEKNL